jgi:hypothetical protein
MKAPLVVLIAIVVSILGFLVVYSLQHDMTTAKSGQAAAGGYGAAAAPAAGGYGAAHTPAAGGYGAAPAPKSGGYGAPPAGGGYGR